MQHGRAISSTREWRGWNERALGLLLEGDANGQHQRGLVVLSDVSLLLLLLVGAVAAPVPHLVAARARRVRRWPVRVASVAIATAAAASPFPATLATATRA